MLIAMIAYESWAEVGFDTQGILFYTDDVGVFSATRRLSRDGDPTQPAIDTRLTDKGSDVVFEPDAVVEHVGGASAPRAVLLPALAESRARYAAKHHGRLTAFLERLGLALEAATHALVGRGGRAARAGHARALLAVARPSQTARARPPL